MVLFLVASTFAIANAQKKDSTTHANKTAAKQKKQSAMKQVGLSKDQEAKIKEANKDYKAKSKQVKGDSSLSATQKKAKIKELTKEKKKQVDTVLTADQKAKLKEIKKEKKANSPQKSKPSPKAK